jgi:alpha-N-arabinofuranosidase
MKLKLPSLAACGLAALFALPVHAAQPVNVAIDASKPGPTIHRNVYGQFAEHLGRGVYEGLWVGPDSKIPNTRGWRNDVVGALKAMHVPLVRWPGGCFADEYHWRDGIGARERRPVKVNNNWGGTENNAVGTHEFFDLVELLGAEAYVNGNLGSGTVQEMAEWMEYMTAEGESTLAKLRRENGRDKPFKVHYFGIGNEAFGCGGDIPPEHFAMLYRQYAMAVRAPHHLKPKFIAAGGTDENTRWTEVLSRDVGASRADSISLHYYTLPTGDWSRKGKATGFPEAEWYSTIANTLKMDKVLADNIAVLDKNDSTRRLGLTVDEWGTWYDGEPNAIALYQQNTLRDAVVAALNLNIFHKYAERVRMTNIAQMVNVLQAMILTDKERMVLTPTYHVFRMHVPFHDAARLPVQVTDGGQTWPAVSVSAAKGKDGKVYLSLVNPDPRQSAAFQFAISGMRVAAARGEVLTAKAIDAHNSFAAPETVKPQPYTALASGGQLQLTLPAKSVVVVALQE